MPQLREAASRRAEGAGLDREVADRADHRIAASVENKLVCARPWHWPLW